MVNSKCIGMVTELYVDHLYLGGGREVKNTVISFEDGIISKLHPFDPFEHIPTTVLRVDVAAPGFIGLQINGACDRQFNDFPDIETVRAIAKGAREGGTTYVLPTYTTAPNEDYVVAMKVVDEAIKAGEPGILGIHLEGPFLSTEKPGIHDPANMRSIRAKDIEHIRRSDAGTILLTLAPECQPCNSITKAVEAGAIVFVGHSNATEYDIKQATKEGLTGATHLFNAMSQLTGREPGVVGSLLASVNLYSGIIADGHHVAWSNIELAAKSMPGRLFLVTDAMQTLEGEQSEIIVHGKKIVLKNGKLCDNTGRLAGAHISMDECVKNMIKCVGVAPSIAVSMASTVPARAIGLDHELGHVKPGFRASITMLSKEFNTQGTIIDGVYFPKAGEKI